MIRIPNTHAVNRRMPIARAVTWIPWSATDGKFKKILRVIVVICVVVWDYFISGEIRDSPDSEG
jgi:hypothetical protein